MKNNPLKYFFLIILLSSAGYLSAQTDIKKTISDSLTNIANDYIFSDKINGIKLNVDKKAKSIEVTANELLGYLPFRQDNVTRIYQAMEKILYPNYPGYRIKVTAYNKDIKELIPGFISGKKDSSKAFINPAPDAPLVTALSLQYNAVQGLQNKYIALWNSHGRYYEQKENRWKWQRPYLFNTTEDLLTTSFVLPFLVPMLENAGARVFIPRERDIQINEVIVDNDKKTTSRYKEYNDRVSWKSSLPGFADTCRHYLYKENPFTAGTSRQISTITDKDETSRAEWIPDIPEKGMYAVYISYQTTTNSAEDARYTVFHLGGKTEFKVNQTMGGGTWIYLGTFMFDKGKNPGGKVILTNLSSEDHKTVTADAVKFGGGMGNMAGVSTLNKMIPNISGFPRFKEGARYWLQWAGVPDSVYSRTQNSNEYSDDYQSRGAWVNYLSGGSPVNPDHPGLGIPIDMAFAFHTDAGIAGNDSIIGTLGICTITNDLGTDTFANGISRWASREMVDMIQTQIVSDIRKSFRSDWTRRGIWNKSYSESRLPEVPTMLLELLSHQNFEDMKFALDPGFKFTVSRAIYKGMLKYLAYTHNTTYVVQPLPVQQFSCEFRDQDQIKLRWKANPDSLEPTALPDRYIIYTRTGQGAFDQGRIVSADSAMITIQPGKIYSFKIAALNDGGESFPSEILSACKIPNGKPTLLVINGFDRISAPENFNLGTMAGFLDDKDAGVPYLYDFSYTGAQYEFSPQAIFADNENAGFGASHREYEKTIIAGNSFDYPYIHGKAIRDAGFSFVSCSMKSILNEDVNIYKYQAVDLILGKQKQTISGNIKKTPEFKTFPLALQLKLSAYCNNGGKLMVSGAYLASDMMNSQDSTDSQFIRDVLKIKLQEREVDALGEITFKSDDPHYFTWKDKFEYMNRPDRQIYYIEYPDFIEPADSLAFKICRFNGSNAGAGVAYRGNYKICAFSFPFETIKEEESRNKLMTSVLNFFFYKK